MSMSEKWPLRCVVGPRIIQMNTCGGFTCHAEALKYKKRKNEKTKRRQECAGLVGPRSIQMNTCESFLCHAEALKNKKKRKTEKQKNRNADKSVDGFTINTHAHPHTRTLAGKDSERTTHKR